MVYIYIALILISTLIFYSDVNFDFVAEFFNKSGENNTTLQDIPELEKSLVNKEGVADEKGVSSNKQRLFN